MQFFNEAWMSSENPADMYDTYLQYLQKVRLPASSKRFAIEQVNLHDCIIKPFFSEHCLTLEAISFSGRRIELCYQDFFLNEKDLHVLKRVSTETGYAIAYDEFIEDDGDFVHRMNFSYANGLDGEIEIVFERFSYSID